MVKAKHFWDFLCNKFNYRFFSGVPCKGLSPLYNAMKSDFLHYVPAVNEKVALGLVSGAYFAGLKGGLLIDMRSAYDLTSVFEFNINYHIPLLIIGYGDKISKLPYDFSTEYVRDSAFEYALDKIIKKIEFKSIPGAVVIGEGVLS